MESRLKNTTDRKIHPEMTLYDDEWFIGAAGINRCFNAAWENRVSSREQRKSGLEHATNESLNNNDIMVAE